MRASAFLFATDLADEGVDAVLDNLQGRAGLDALTLACAYHHARDVFPHNPVRRVRYLEGGAVFFRPDPRRYARLRIQPHVSSLARERDLLVEAASATRARGMALRAWTVFLHNTTLASRHPACAQQNAFGDPYLTSLCPAHPDARAYAVALAADIARDGVESILAESLGYHGFDHGYHHERAFVPLPPLARFLFGLCFCEHCRAAANAQDVDADGVCRWTRARLERVLADDAAGLEGEVTEATVAEMADGAMRGYLTARAEVVTSLVAETRRAVEAEGATKLVYMDMSGAAKGYATGAPAGGPAADIAWQDGVDLAGVGRAAHGLALIGYARDPARVGVDIAAYRAALPTGLPLSAALRPLPPDCDHPANLAAKVTVAREQGLEWVDFYHYGFMPLNRLDWIRHALSSLR